MTKARHSTDGVTKISRQPELTRCSQGGLKSGGIDTGHHEEERDFVSASRPSLSGLEKELTTVGESNREEIVHTASTWMTITQIAHKGPPEN